MKRRVVLLSAVFVFFILVFFLQKGLFVLMHGKVNEGVSIVEMLQVLYYGIDMDMSVSGYLTVLPAFLILASVWIKTQSLTRIMTIYFFAVISVIAIITSVDVLLYAHWGFHLDPVVLFYLKNPQGVAAGGANWEWILGVAIVFVFISAFYYIYSISIRKVFLKLTIPLHRIPVSLALLLSTGVLFLPIRGGVTVSTMNISRAYFSERMFLNHAAINPVFNFLYLLNKSDDFGSQYQFFEKDEAIQIFKRLNEQPESVDRIKLLRTDRPNIILFILESFSHDVALDSVVAPNMSRFAKEGVFFNHFYANTFRTDRGLTSILSGYPAHPTTAILKYPKKTDNLPAFPRFLRANGYKDQTLYYGGDVNFANMLSYFIGSCGIPDIVSDNDFPIKERLSKWGVPDKPLLERVISDLKAKNPNQPFLKIILTLSSHEPFDVPNKKFDVPYLNAINYTDECIGRFVSDLKTTDLWDNTLVIFIADHTLQGYPQGFNNYDRIRFHIPMIWTGGAVAQPQVITDYGSQNDLAATLLAQLKIDHTDFIFSKDMLNPAGRKFAFYAYVNGFCMIDSTGVFLYDNNQQQTLKQTGDPNLENEAKAFFQMMYLDLGSR